jgi:putative phosphoesterase
MARIGVISDTHGKLPSEVHDAFAGAERIVHAGDIGNYQTLLELETIAPVTAVAGNVDPELGDILPPLVNTPIAGVRFLVTHRRQDVPRPLPPGVAVVVTGHTHMPVIEERDGVLWLNPGSASRSRGAGHTVAVLEIEDGVVVVARIMQIDAPYVP